jgi:cytochrome c oxidase subunit II
VKVKSLDDNKILPPQQSLPKRILVKRLILFGVLAFSYMLTGCAPATNMTGVPNALDTRGPISSVIAFEWWIQFALGMVVYIVVVGILLYIIFNRGIRDRGTRDVEIVRDPGNQGISWILWGGVIIPVVILAGLLGLSIFSHISLAAPDEAPVLRVEVTGHRWWWEVRYPDEGIVSANEIHIPVGRPVEIHLTSRDVIHSFWVPQLAGKLDLNPGETNSMWLQANEPGIYRGICAEFCGLQHANMQFVVVASSEADFQEFLERESQHAPEPEDEQAIFGQQVFLNSSCVYCHTIRGTDATGELGPDLTHIASRLTIGAGILENNRGNLAGWIVDPQTFKPGNLMPPNPMTGEELQALLAYLDTLR